MFGALSNLFKNSAEKALMRHSDDIARNLAVNAGEDVASSALTDLGLAAAKPETNKVASALRDFSKNALNDQYSITRAGMRGIGEGADDVISNLYNRTGISNLDDLTDLSRELSKGTDAPYTAALEQMRTNNGINTKVDLTDLNDTINDLVGQMPKPLQNKYARGDIDALELAKTFHNEANVYKTKGVNPNANKGMYNLYNDTAHEIDRRIDSMVPQDVVNQHWDNLADEYKYRSHENALAGNNKKAEAYKNLAKELEETPMEERTIAAFRHNMKDFTDVGKIAAKNDESKGGGTLESIAGKIPLIGDALAAVAKKPADAATRKAGEVASSLANKFESGEVQDTLKKLAGGTAAVAGGAMLLGGAGNNGSEGNDLPVAQMPDGPGGADPRSAMAVRDVAALSQATAQEPTFGGYKKSDLEASMLTAMQNGDMASAKMYQTVLGMMQQGSGTSSAKGAASSKQAVEDQKAAKKAAKAEGAINNLLQTYERGGGAQSGVGALSNLLNKATFGMANPNQSAYEANSQPAAVALARAMGDSGALSNQDIENYKKMLPQFSDNPATARAKINAIYSSLHN